MDVLADGWVNGGRGDDTTKNREGDTLRQTSYQKNDGKL